MPLCWTWYRFRIIGKSCKRQTLPGAVKASLQCVYCPASKAGIYSPTCRRTAVDVTVGPQGRMWDIQHCMVHQTKGASSQGWLQSVDGAPSTLRPGLFFFVSIHFYPPCKYVLYMIDPLSSWPVWQQCVTTNWVLATLCGTHLHPVTETKF